MESEKLSDAKALFSKKRFAKIYFAVAFVDIILGFKAMLGDRDVEGNTLVCSIYSEVFLPTFCTLPKLIDVKSILGLSSDLSLLILLILTPLHLTCILYFAMSKLKPVKNA